MSAFQDMILSDIETVFFNLDELAGTHQVNGRSISVIIDQERLEEMKAKPKYADGYNTATNLIYVKAADLPGKPAQGSHLELDGKIYRVQSVSGEDVWEITLEANR